MTKDQIQIMFDDEATDSQTFSSFWYHVKWQYGYQTLSKKILKEITTYGNIVKNSKNLAIENNICRERNCLVCVNWYVKLNLNYQTIILEPRCLNHFYQYWQKIKRYYQLQT